MKKSVASPLRVMTFNVRYGTADDKENHWDKRQGAFLEAITTFAPDLLCTQETLAMQRDFLIENLKDYGCVAVGREDGKETGEMTAIFYNEKRFEKIDSGHFWLSRTPEIPASVGWDAALTRMTSWVKLRDRSDPKSLPILLLNAHLDHRGNQSRIESCKLIRRKALELGTGCRVIVAGDFNCIEDDPAYKALVQPPLADAYRLVHPNRDPNEATFHAFHSDRIKGSRIDWIIADPSFKPIEANIDRNLYQGRLPSDHFPVKIVFE